MRGVWGCVGVRVCGGEGGCVCVRDVDQLERP